MSWEELETKEPKKPEESEERKAIRRAVMQAFNHPDLRPLREELERVSILISYLPGRSPEEVAFNEGYRKLAVDLLKLGEAHE